MKQILLATTAVFALTGAAYAEVSISGSAEFGVVDGELQTDLDVSFDLTGESGGLTYGASADLSGAGDLSGAEVWISGGSWTVSVGDTDSALDNSMIGVDSLDSLGGVHDGHLGLSLGDTIEADLEDAGITLSPIITVRADITFGDITASMSVAKMDDVTIEVSGITITAFPNAGPMIGFGVNWNGDMGGMEVGVGAGYQSFDINETGFGRVSQTGISGSLGFGSVTALASYSIYDLDLPKNATHKAIGVTYELDALSLHANWGEYEYDGDKISGFGVAVNYDLSDDLVLMAGYGKSKISGVSLTDDDSWSVGMNMSF